MNLDMLLYELRDRSIVIINQDELWPSPLLTCKMKQAFRRHRNGIKLLLQDADVRTCASPARHRPYYRYTGDGRYVCSLCEQFLEEVS